jgi:hypothetical protein
MYLPACAWSVHSSHHFLVLWTAQPLYRHNNDTRPLTKAMMDLAHTHNTRVIINMQGTTIQEATQRAELFKQYHSRILICTSLINSSRLEDIPTRSHVCYVAVSEPNSVSLI